jgi:hypothetical protein
MEFVIIKGLASASRVSVLPFFLVIEESVIFRQHTPLFSFHLVSEPSDKIPDFQLIYQCLTLFNKVRYDGQ